MMENFSVKSTQHGRTGSSIIYNAFCVWGSKAVATRPRRRLDEQRAGGECSWGRHLLAWADCSVNIQDASCIMPHLSIFQKPSSSEAGYLCTFLECWAKIRVQNKTEVHKKTYKKINPRPDSTCPWFAFPALSQQVLILFFEHYPKGFFPLSLDFPTSTFAQVDFYSDDLIFKK